MRMRCMWAAVLAALVLCVGTLRRSSAQGRNPAEGMGSPLAGLMLPHGGSTKHEGSWDRSGGNGDARPVNPGDTLTLLDYKGAGIIRRFWVTIAPRSEMVLHRECILRMYWDNEPTPSVEVPIGDFFGVGFGEQHDYISLPLNETSGGYNCYWPMPFHKSARWTLTNLSKRKLDSFYYNIDFTAYDRLPKELRHFHAQWRRENPTTKGKNYTILEATGEGHYVGTALFMQARRGHGIGFLEGDEMVYVDGEDKPSINGTGTEDYFSSGWYFDRGTYSAPYHGCVIKDEKLGRISAYRWHIEDAMPYRNSIRVTIEHGNQNDTEADYSSVAYWYQNEPHAAFPPLPTNPDDFLPFVPPPPYKIPGAIEGESLIATAKASEGEVSEQGLAEHEGQWSDDKQLWWRPGKEGAALTLQLPAPEDGTYQLMGYFTKAKDYGKIQVLQGDTPLGSEIDLYHDGVVPTGPIDLGKVTLKAGPNPLVVKVTGKNPLSTGHLVGIDAFTLKKM